MSSLHIYTGTAIWSLFLYTSAQHNSNYTLEMYNINISMRLTLFWMSLICRKIQFKKLKSKFKQCFRPFLIFFFDSSSSCVWLSPKLIASTEDVNLSKWAAVIKCGLIQQRLSNLPQQSGNVILANFNTHLLSDQLKINYCSHVHHTAMGYIW